MDLHCSWNYYVDLAGVKLWECAIWMGLDLASEKWWECAIWWFWLMVPVMGLHLVSRLQ